MKLDFRPYQPGDETAIMELFTIAFKRPELSNFWEWRFVDNPNGFGVIELAWDGPVLAGHYAVSPIVIHVNGIDYTAALSGTTMTHPAYQGLKLFPTLAERVYARMGQDGMLMVMGFPNNYSHRIIVRDITWTDIHEVPTFRKDFDDGVALPTPSAGVESLTTFDSRFDALWVQVKDRYPVIVCRDAAYLNWRYVTNPAFEYTRLALTQNKQLMGYAVCKPYQDGADLVDLLAVDNKFALELVWAVCLWARERAAKNINLWLNYSLPLHRELEKHGFCNRDPITYFGGRLTLPGATGDMFNFKHWYLTMSDSDVF